MAWDSAQKRHTDEEKLDKISATNGNKLHSLVLVSDHLPAGPFLYPDNV